MGTDHTVIYLHISTVTKAK